jgi:molybdenum-dependent DNA-binding transcriptional regulator ModE
MKINRMSKSQRIRNMRFTEQRSVKAIAKLLGMRYQRVWNTVKRQERKIATVSR